MDIFAHGTVINLMHCHSPKQKEEAMDKEHVKGVIKDAAGKVMDDKELQVEGKIDKAKGSAHNVAGNVKDADREASKEAKKE